MDMGSADIGTVDPSSSVLLLGSGFSLGAVNVRGTHLPNGSGLRSHFLQLLGLPQDTSLDLALLADEFAESEPRKLRDELSEIFRITALSSAQKEILSESWLRIYTTNYDDAVELYRRETRAAANTFDMSEPVPNKIANGAIVHLHRSVRLITEENIKSSLVLSGASYVKQILDCSSWYDQFQRDLNFAYAFYIVGYSLSDYYISSLLLANPALASRTIFIQGTRQDDGRLEK